MPSPASSSNPARSTPIVTTCPGPRPERALSAAAAADPAALAALVAESMSGVAAGARVVVAMSGGVDSAVTAGLLARAGYEVVGITLQLYDQGRRAQRTGSCCAGQDIADARRVAERLSIPHYVLDYESRFRSGVINRFVDAYAAGQTPVPCAACNQTVKFADLLQVARELGADALATGHYARRVQGPAGPQLHAGADPIRDQSYFLYGTTRAQLDYLRFPLGGQPKATTRAAAAALGLAVAEKPDSQDICFVPDGRYADLVRRLRPETAAPGDIVDEQGRVLGRHDGIVNYTVGQRRGLALGGQEEPLFVLRLDPERRQVVVGPKARLGQQRVPIHDLNWLGDGPPTDSGEAVTVKLRSAQPPQPARFFAVAEPGGIEAGVLELDAPAVAAPGQAAVLYRGSRVLGGGVIAASG